MTPKDIAIAGYVLDTLRERFRAAGTSRGWSFDWPERSGYAHGELAELVEAVRGKRGEVPDEAGDVLCTALFGLVPPDVSMAEVLYAAAEKIDGIENRTVGVDGVAPESAWERGWSAHAAGKSFDSNPYPPLTSEASEWGMGFRGRAGWFEEIGDGA